MQNVGIIPNTTRDLDFKQTRNTIKYIKKCGKKCFMETKFRQHIVDEDVIFTSNLYSQIDFVVTLGGDGTILTAAKEAARFNIPIFGINIGFLGYLTDVEEKDFKKAIDNIFSGNYKLEKRMMLQTALILDKKNSKLKFAPFAVDEIQLNSTPLNNKTSYNCGIALNDVCFLKSAGSKVIDIKIFINNEFMDNYLADGVIIATPTGSTAYNLSANGPILKPDSQMIVITPICPHNLYVRPIVVSSNDIITIVLAPSKKSIIQSTSATLCLDGNDIIYDIDSQTVEVKMSDFYTTILKTNKLGFYDILRMKMMTK